MKHHVLLLPFVLLACSAGSAPDAPAAGPTRADGPPDGPVLYQTHCTLCHGKDGRLGLSGARDLSISALSREEVMAVVAGGKGRMLGYRETLKAAELEAVVDHVLALRVAPPSRP